MAGLLFLRVYLQVVRATCACVWVSLGAIGVAVVVELVDFDNWLDGQALLMHICD